MLVAIATQNSKLSTLNSPNCMFTAKVYNVMVGSLSGIMEEVFAVREVIRQWNQQHAQASCRVLLPAEWTTAPAALDATDVVIALVDNWVGDTRAIDHCIAAGKHVILLFNAFADPGNTIESEHQAVAAFRERVQSHCRCLEYRGTVQLKQRMEEAIGEI